LQQETTMDRTALKAVIDAVFVEIEAAEAGHPLVLVATKFLNGVVDGPVLDAIAQRLGIQGISVQSGTPH
jgi:hypothetical protein